MTDLLVATSSNFLLKYDQQGYNGYYQSQGLQEVYDILVMMWPGVVAVCGKGNCIELVQL